MVTIEQVVGTAMFFIFSSLVAANVFFIKRMIANLDINTRITQALKTEVEVIKAVLRIRSPSSACPDEGKS